MNHKPFKCVNVALVVLAMSSVTAHETQSGTNTEQPPQESTEPGAIKNTPSRYTHRDPWADKETEAEWVKDLAQDLPGT